MPRMGAEHGGATDLLDAGRVALARGRWTEAEAAYRAAVEQGSDPEAWEGLASAASWLDDADTLFEARQRAHVGYRARGDDRGAGRTALWLALDYLNYRGELAVMRGWLRRARSLLDPLPACTEQAMALGVEAHIAAVRDADPQRALDLARRARAVAAEIEDREVVSLATGLEGLALVTAGEVADGMSRLDEASTAVIAGDVPDLELAATILCYVISACERARDLDRAEQWCEQMRTYCERAGYPTMVAACRTQYAGILLSRGTWKAAEEELAVATDVLREARPAMAGDGLVRLAELRRRQGRIAEAEALCTEAERDPFAAQAGPRVALIRAEMALERGDPATAIDLADRYLRAVHSEDRLQRVPALEIVVVAFAAADRLVEAGAAADELAAIALDGGTLPLLGAAASARGVVRAAAGADDEARRAFEDAVDRYERAHMPFEAAVARLRLAREMRRTARESSAAVEAERARATLASLGLDPGAIATLDPAGPRRADPAGLSPREVEVIALVAHGKTNDEIARELYLSVRTVERHLSNIYGKIGASGPAARVVATEHAHRHGYA